MILSLLQLLGACAPLDGSDCRSFSDCERYLPSGLNCGLAHESFLGSQQTGSSCGGEGRWHDPAARSVASGATSARKEARPCPSGYSRGVVPDHDGGDYDLASCTAVGTPELPPRPEDLPEGAVCGLDTDSGYALCADLVPAQDMACPPGWSLRWVPDIYWDTPADDTCISHQDNDSNKDIAKQVDLLLFCDNDAGCTGPDCLTAPVYPGLICGLHAEPYVGQDPLAQWHTLIKICPEHPLLEHAEAIEAAAARPATCLGQPVSEGCPEGMVRSCTWDRTASCPLRGPNVHQEALCWCALPSAVQGEQPPPSWWEDPPDFVCD